MQIGDTVKIIRTNEVGKIINTGEGWSAEDGKYILYSVLVGSGKYARVYSIMARDRDYLGRVRSMHRVCCA